jgi:hypothetical protein
MLYMIIEHFRDGNAVPVYRRFRERGRLAPEGLRYVSSWVTHDLRRCYQVMECDDRALLDEWLANWKPWQRSRRRYDARAMMPLRPPPAPRPRAPWAR